MLCKAMPVLLQRSYIRREWRFSSSIKSFGCGGLLGGEFGPGAAGTDSCVIAIDTDSDVVDGWPHAGASSHGVVDLVAEEALEDLLVLRLLLSAIDGGVSLLLQDVVEAGGPLAGSQQAGSV